jgi:hypothetical protein
MTRTRRILIAVASVAVAASVAAPASAAEDTFTDKEGDLRGGFDIQSVRVVNTGKWIKIRTHHRNLRYGDMAPGGGVSVYIDTARRRNGPEFRFAGPVGFDGDYAILRTRRWEPVGGPLNCNLRFGVNYKRDVVRFAVTRRCLDRIYDHRVGKIRVAVQAAQSRVGSGDPRIDWAPKRRTLYPAVPRG